jgi:hypothetical protein
VAQLHLLVLLLQLAVVGVMVKLAGQVASEQMEAQLTMVEVNLWLGLVSKTVAQARST